MLFRSAASLGLRALGAIAQQVQLGAADARPAELARLIDSLEEVFELSRAECLAAGLLITPPAARVPA